MNDVTTVQTMGTFQKILVQKSVEPQEITVDLYKFANFYDIQPLVKFCGEHLGSKINKENVLEIAMAADLVDDEGLLKKAAQFPGASEPGGPGGAGPPLESRIYKVKFLKIVKI